MTRSDRAKRSIALLALAASLLATGLPAQEPDPVNRHPYTLHAYANLIDIPTLVLNAHNEPIAPVDSQKFRIHIDSGPRFRPTYVRREDNDPIALAILLDLSGSQNDLLAAFTKATHTWATESLRPADHVSVYAIDCHTIRTLNDAAADPGLLPRAIDAATHDKTVHGTNTHSACANSLHLFDAMAFILHDLNQRPGRRVLLTVTDGYDGGSKVTDTMLRNDAVMTAVTVFNLGLSSAGSMSSEAISGSMPNIMVSVTSDAAEALALICARSGGLALTTTADGVATSLRTFVQMLRGRYILEFPRPANATPGFHDIEVDIEHTTAVVRPAGINVPLPTQHPSNDLEPAPADATNPDVNQ